MTKNLSDYLAALAQSMAQIMNNRKSIRKKCNQMLSTSDIDKVSVAILYF